MNRSDFFKLIAENSISFTHEQKLRDAVDEYTSAIIEQSKCCALLPVDNVTRVEVINNSGRAFVSWDERSKIELQLQDENRTLKVFVSKRQ